MTGSTSRDWRIFRPSAGIVTTKKDTQAMTWPERNAAEWIADRLKGHIAEVWETDAERLIRWGDRCTG